MLARELVGEYGEGRFQTQLGGPLGPMAFEFQHLMNVLPLPLPVATFPRSYHHQPQQLFSCHGNHDKSGVAMKCALQQLKARILLHLSGTRGPKSEISPSTGAIQPLSHS